jgi:hypothetical protein
MLMTIEIIELENYVDPSYHNMELPNLHHPLQIAERIVDLLNVVGLLHDILGTIVVVMCTRNWAVMIMLTMPCQMQAIALKCG